MSKSVMSFQPVPQAKFPAFVILRKDYFNVKTEAIFIKARDISRFIADNQSHIFDAMRFGQCQVNGAKLIGGDVHIVPKASLALFELDGTHFDATMLFAMDIEPGFDANPPMPLQDWTRIRHHFRVCKPSNS